MRANISKDINMNRHDRRAAQAKARHAGKNGISQIVAVHEAGHAVAKVLAAGELGYSINEAVKYIDMGTGDSLRRSVDGKMMLRSQGVTFGPIFSRDIQTASSEFAQSFMGDRGSLEGRESFELRSKVVELGRAAGADIGKWFRARVFDAVSGSIADPKARVIRLNRRSKKRRAAAAIGSRWAGSGLNSSPTRALLALGPR
jgi:hypothetical protein